MKTRVRNNQSGTLLVPFAVSLGLTLCFIVLFVWAFASRQSFKNNVEDKVAIAIEQTKEEVIEQKDKEFAEEQKNPLTTYTGAASLGTVKVSYPKSWNVYVDTEASGQVQLDLKFHPGYIPASGKLYATRVQVLARPYTDQLSTYSQAISKGSITAIPYVFPSLKNQTGTLLSGQIDKNYTGKMVLMPIRDKTLVVWTEGQEYLSDFEKIVLENISFIP